MNSDEKNKTLTEDEQCDSMTGKATKEVDKELAESELETVAGGGIIQQPRGQGETKGRLLY